VVGPHALSLGAEASFGIRRESLIMKDVPQSVVNEGLRDYQRWQDRHADAVAAGSTATLHVRTVTEWAADAAADLSVFGAATALVAPSAPVQYGLFEAPPERPAPPVVAVPDVTVVDLRAGAREGGARFGELVHAVLASAPLGGTRAEFEAAAEVHARILGAPDEERDAAVTSAQRVAAHDLLRRAAAADARAGPA
jgi:hypothetical protein